MVVDSGDVEMNSVEGGSAEDTPVEKSMAAAGGCDGIKPNPAWEG
jgi:hypothetical protein